MSVTLLRKLHRDILGELQEVAYFNREKKFENRLIGTFPAGLCSTETLIALTWITFKCAWLFNVAFATNRIHAIQDSFFYTITYVFNILIDMND
jgi:hypothetical protein